MLYTRAIICEIVHDKFNPRANEQALRGALGAGRESPERPQRACSQANDKLTQVVTDFSTPEKWN